MNKRGQIAIFIIVGLVVLIGGVIFFYTTQRVQAPSSFKPTQVPLELDPVQKYVNDCIGLVGVEGLRIIGKQGGYISFTDRGLNKEIFTTTQNPTESDAVSFAADLRIPYWWYLKSSNSCASDCNFASKRPELRERENSIEKQLERYIDLRLDGCLNDFEPLSEQGFEITVAGKLKTDVVIGSDDVSILVEYPLTVERESVKSDMERFLVAVPIDLERIYDLATKITNLEIKHHFLEKHVLNLLAAFSGTNRDKLPPMSDMQFKFGSTTSWQKSDVKNKIEELLTSYMQLFQIDGTYNYDRNLFYSELKQRLYDSTILPVANNTFKDLAVDFAYLDFWPMYFDLNCKGERCVPSSTSSLLSFLGIQTYRFAYDLSFPVLVEIKDTSALDEQGYSFNVFLEGNIRNNKHMDTNFATLDILEASEKSQLCDVRTSGNVAINVVDAFSKKPIDDAQVLYTVIDENCFIGSTNSDGNVAEKFPVGVGGVVNAIKDGYIGRSVEFDPKVDVDDSLTIELQPIYTKKLVVEKKNVVKTSKNPPRWEFIDQAVELSDKESVAVSLTRINDGGELDFSSVANYEGRKEPAEFEIAAGSYAVNIDLALNERIWIPEREICKRIFLFKKECFTIPEVDFGERFAPGEERFPEGGLKLDITLDDEDLANHGTIVLYAVGIDMINVPESDRVVEDLEQLGKIEDYSNIYQLALQPEFR